MAHHFQDGAATDAPAHQTLSDRELQVLLRIGAGRTVGEVARELHLSVKTVSTHKTRLMQKMRIERDADLVRYVLDHELA